METERLVDYGAYIKENIGVDSLRLLAFIINFINLFNFFKFYSRYPALNCRLIYKRQKETIQDSSYFQKETFLLPKTGESLPKKTSNFFFNLSVCLLACCCFSCFSCRRLFLLKTAYFGTIKNGF